MKPISKAEVEAYFSARLGSPVSIRSMKPTFPGLSRETFIVLAEVAGHSQDFALRLDYPWGGSCPNTLRQEWEVYSRLWQSPVPVAEPLWFDAGIDFAEGRPHMVRRLVDGSTAIQGLGDAGAEGDRLRRRIAFECAEKLALLHTLDWKAYGFDSFLTPPASPQEALRSELRSWSALWEQRRPGANAVIAEALCWLEESLPTDTPFISVNKGNNGIGEEIWRDGKIIAMSDWELTSLGDGALDLAFSQGTLTLSDYAETLRHYEECVGHAVSPERLAAATFLTWFKQIILGRVYMYGHYRDGQDRRIHMLSFGLVTTQLAEQRLAQCIGKGLVEAWATVSDAEKNPYLRVARSK